MIGSFNAFGQTSKVFDAPSIPVWLGVVTSVPMGGSLDSAFVKPRALYPAGTPISLVNKVIKPFIYWVVKSFSSGESDTIVLNPARFGGVDFVPQTTDFVMALNGSFKTAGKGAAVASVTTAENGEITVTVATGSLGAVEAGSILVLTDAAGEGKLPSDVPNHYLRNDIAFGDIDVTREDAGASGSGVRYHHEGILIKRTPGAEIADALAEVIPGVLQVNA